MRSEHLLTIVVASTLVLHLFDAYTTFLGIRLGACEVNPHIAPFQDHIPLFEQFLVHMKVGGVVITVTTYIYALMDRRFRFLWIGIFSLYALFLLATVVSNFHVLLQIVPPVRADLGVCP